MKIIDERILRFMHSPHWSATSCNKPPALWAFEYIYLGERRKQMEPNARMALGIATQKGADAMVLQGEPVEEAVRHAMPRVDAHQPRSYDLERDTKALEHYRDLLGDVITNSAAGIREALEGSNRIEGEGKPIWTSFDDVELPFLLFPDYDGCRTVDLKTKWPSLTKTKKGESWRTASLPAKPSYMHVQQVALYSHATGKPPALVYANATGHRVFTEENCDELSPASCTAALNRLKTSARSREALMRAADDRDHLFEMLEPDFSHFMWDLAPELLDEAKEIWR